MTAGDLWRGLHEWTGIIVVIATNTDIMFSARPLKSVEEAIIINVKRYSEVHRVTQTDRCHRPVVLPDNPPRDIGPRYRFHERSLHLILFFLERTEQEDRRDRSSSLTCISRQANSTDVFLHRFIFNSERSVSRTSVFWKIPAPSLFRKALLSLVPFWYPQKNQRTTMEVIN